MDSTTAPGYRSPCMATPRKPPAEPPAAEPEGEVPPRPRGRPRVGKTTRSIHVSVPLDVADWLDKQPNASAAVTEAVRALMKVRRTRR